MIVKQKNAKADLKVISAGVARKVILQRPDLDLFREGVLLVEEEDEGGAVEPADVADGREQLQRLVHPVDHRVLRQFLERRQQPVILDLFE